MLINKVQNDVNFRAIKLSETDLMKSSQIFGKLLNTEISQKEKALSQAALYNILKPYLEQEAKIKMRLQYMFAETLSEISLKFSELLYDINKYPSIAMFIEQLDNFKPTKDSVKSCYIHSSLDENAFRDNNKVKKIDNVTEKDLPNPTSAIVIDETKRKLNKIIEKSPISEIQKNRMKTRATGMKYKEIASQDGVSKSAAYFSIKQSIHKIQYENGNLPQEIVERLKTTAAMLECDINTFMKAVLKSSATALFTLDPEIIKRNVQENSEKLGCTFEEFTRAALKQPSLFYQKPETIINNVTESSKQFGFTKKEFVNAALKQPGLFQLKAETIMKNLTDSAKFFDCTIKEFTKIALIQPQLFYQKPETLINNIKESSKLLKCSVEKYVKIGLKQPSLFFTKPITLLKNIEKSSELLRCSFEDFVKAGLKQPNLFYQKPETLMDNATKSSELLNCSFEKFVKAGLQQPQLFCLKPETLLKNVTESAQILGCSIEDFTETCLKQPSLFCMKPETLGKKLKLENYYRKLQNKDVTNKLARFDSDKKVYSKILGILIKNADKNSIKNVNDYDLEQFLKANQDKTFSLEIPQDEVAEDFIKFVQETSIKTIGKNIFEFKIVE